MNAPRCCWWCDDPPTKRRPLVELDGTDYHEACVEPWRRAQHFKPGHGPETDKR